MGKLSFEAAMGAAKIAFCWNSSDGSIEDFQKDMANLLFDYSEDQIMNMARRIGNATNYVERTDITSKRTTNCLS